MMRRGSLRGFSVISNIRIRATLFISLACIGAVIMAMSFVAPGSAAEGPNVTTGADRDLAQQLVSGTINSYTSYTRASFTDGVSDDFPADKYALVNRVERKFYKARPIQLDYFINLVNRTGDKLSVSFTWEKKVMVRATGLQQNSKGQSMFVYKQTNGAWQLYDIKGQSPL